MTEEEFEQLRQMTHASVQDENGIDVTLIDQKLALTPTERLAALEELMALGDFLADVRVRHYGPHPRTPVEAELDGR